MKKYLSISNNISIPVDELHFRFTRGGGPGGQNVNKVETRVELLFDVTNSKNLTDEQKSVVRSKLASRINANGLLRIVVSKSRSQLQNREIAIERFIKLLQNALTPQRKRVPTRIPDEMKEKRLKYKKRRSEIKKMRQCNKGLL